MDLKHSINADNTETKDGEDSLQHNPAPDGGFGWVIVVCCFFVSMVISFNVMSYGIFIGEFKTTLGWSESELGVLGSLRLGISSLSGLATGPLVQQYGFRRISIVAIMISTLSYLLPCFFENKMMIFGAFGVLAGIGAGMVGIPCIIIVQTYFNKKRAKAAALASVGFSFWAMVASPLTQFLVDVYGWRGALMLLAGINLQNLVPAALFRPLPKPSSGGKLSIAPETQDKGFSLRNKLKQLFRYYFNRKLFTKRYILFVITQSTRALIVDGYYLRLAPIGRSFGIDDVSASFLPSAVSLTSMINRVVGGFLASLLTPLGVYGIFNTGCALTVFCVPFLPSSFTAHAVVGLFFGISIGNVFGIQHTCLVTINGLELLPLGLSWNCIFMGVARVLGNLMIGWMLELTGSYSVALWITSFIHMFGSLCALISIAITYRINKEKETLSAPTQKLPIENTTKDH